jgi:hypothetical protein
MPKEEVRGSDPALMEEERGGERREEEGGGGSSVPYTMDSNRIEILACLSTSLRGSR